MARLYNNPHASASLIWPFFNRQDVFEHAPFRVLPVLLHEVCWYIQCSIRHRLIVEVRPKATSKFQFFRRTKYNGFQIRAIGKCLIAQVGQCAGQIDIPQILVFRKLCPPHSQRCNVPRQPSRGRASDSGGTVRYALCQSTLFSLHHQADR